MMTSVASDPDGIGYISLGSLNDSVKAVKIDGIEATAQNVKEQFDERTARARTIFT